MPHDNTSKQIQSNVYKCFHSLYFSSFLFICCLGIECFTVVAECIRVVMLCTCCKIHKSANKGVFVAIIRKIYSAIIKQLFLNKCNISNFHRRCLVFTDTKLDQIEIQEATYIYINCMLRNKSVCAGLLFNFFQIESYIKNGLQQWQRQNIRRFVYL